MYNEITVQPASNESSAEALQKAADAISQKTQADIADSIRLGGNWSKIIRASV